MNEFSRQTRLEDNFEDMHKIKPQIYYLRINKNQYKIKLTLGNKQAIITEIMEGGLPKTVTLEYDGIIENFKFPIEAERRATEILREQ
jgi:capsule polysaccharide modification protein KpsS